MSMEIAAIVGMAIIALWGIGALVLAMRAAKSHHPADYFNR